jgi:hypothetical protein
VSAQWTNVGQVNGIQIYRDNRTGLEWTVSLGRSNSFNTANQRVAGLGFRLPTHSQFRSLEKNGGINKLRINTAWLNGFYWEASGNVVNGNGGNFSSLFPSTRAGAANAYAIGVRNGGTQQVVQPQPAIPNPTPSSTGTKIHMLFVWGTKDAGIYHSTKISQKKIFKAFPYYNGSGFDLPLEDDDDFKRSPYIANYISLEGDNAHPKKILDACRQLSNAAGPNDAVFVYILCHGAQTTDEEYTNQPKPIHVLSPVAESPKNLDLKTIGIRRSSIMRELKLKPHRLNMLITDSCSTEDVGGWIPNAPDERHKVGPDVIPALKKILLEGRGTLNINSTDPRANNGMGELAMGWFPSDNYDRDADLDVSAIGKTGDAYLEAAAVHYPYSGTVFTNAFIECAKREIPVNSNYTIEQFYDDLKKQLPKTFDATVDHLANGGDKSVKTFQLQGTQTLTKFDDWGIAVP